jgi:hypothetical protein
MWRKTVPPGGEEGGEAAQQAGVRVHPPSVPPARILYTNRFKPLYPGLAIKNPPKKTLKKPPKKTHKKCFCFFVFLGFLNF